MKNMRHQDVVRKTIMALAISVCFAGNAMAQSSDGSVFGRTTTAKSKVTLQSLENGSSRQIEANADGSFTFSKVAPGKYRITANGMSREIEVAMGTGSEVRLEDASTVVIKASRTRSAIDVSSTESNTVFTQAEIQSMPIARSATAVAMLAPGTVQGDAGLANLPSFGGASIAENGYYINGMDVTNIRNFLSFASLPFDAIEQQQVKTGGYGAEYGRSLGGVVGLTTKRGTNTWKGGAAVIWSPQGLNAKGLNKPDYEVLDNPNGYYIFGRANMSNSTEVNFNLGGPLIQDKLFIWGMVTQTRANADAYGKTSSSASESGTPTGMVKLDFVPNGDHRFEFTGISNNAKSTSYTWLNPTGQNYVTQHLGDPRISTNKTISNVVIGKYTGYITDDLSVSLLHGGTNAYYGLTKGAGASRPYDPSCPAVTGPASGQRQGCYAWPAVSTRDPKAGENFDKRRNTRLDLEYIWGQHTIRAGIDNQVFDSAQAGSVNSSGGKTYAYAFSKDGAVNGVPNVVAKGAEYVTVSDGYQTSGIYRVINDAMYLEDNWRPVKNVVTYGGLRWESFDNRNSDGVSFVKKKNLFSPRFGASWDVNGDSTLKIYGNAGRYYIPVASNTNIRGTRIEYSETRYYTFTGKDGQTAVPTGLKEIGQAIINGSDRLPNPATVADPNLKPMNQDEFILGFQKAWDKSLSYGVKYTKRKVNAGMDDYCGTAPIAKWAKEQGYAKFDWHSLAGCVLMNPGEDLTLAMDLNGDGKLVYGTIPKKYLGLARYERLYDALEFSLDRPFDGVWGGGASYVWSKSRGTAEGYVQSNLNQGDAGITQDFDFGSFTDGAFGYLPNDRRHQFKFYGSYKVNDNWTLGFNSRVVSGRATSCLGFVPTTVPDYLGASGTTSGGSGAYGSASSYYCLNASGVSELHPRGSGERTPWTKQLDLSVNYDTKIAGNNLTIQFSLVNLFDSRTVQEWQERSDYSRSTSKAPPGRFSMNYKNGTVYQSPRYLRLSARYNF